MSYIFETAKKKSPRFLIYIKSVFSGWMTMESASGTIPIT